MKVFTNYLIRITAPAILAIVVIFFNLTPKVLGDDQGDKNFTTIDFPGADSQVFASPSGINSNGDIVGGYRTADGKAHGYLLSKGIFTSIDFPPGNFNVTVARGINDRGDIVGFFNTPGPRLGFLLHDGSFTSFNFPNSSFTENIMAINNRGDILGHYIDSCDGVFHDGLLNGNSFTRIDFPGATISQDFGLGGINNRGDIVGNYISADGIIHGFLMSRNSSNTSNLSSATSASPSRSILRGPTVSFTTIDFPGAIVTFASGINDRGEIVGGYTSVDNRRHGFLLSGDSFTTIDFPGAPNTNGAFGINNRGDIVGQYAMAGKGHGFLLRRSNGNDD